MNRAEINSRQRFSMAMSTCSIISAILVIWIHAYNIEVYSSSNRVLYWIQEAISQGIARGAVPFFMMSSAFFLYSKSKTVSDVYRSRSKSVLLPYLLWNVVYMVAFAVLRRLSLTNTGMDVVTVENVLGGIFWHKYNYAYWFMRDLILLVALYPLLRWLLNRGKTISWIVWGILGVVIFAVSLFEDNSLLSELCHDLRSVFYYYLGAMIGQHYARQAENVVCLSLAKQWWTIAGLFAFSVTTFACGCLWENAALDIMRDLSTALLMFFIVVRLHIRIDGVLTGLSFMVFSLHPFILEVVEKLIYRFCPHTDLWMMVDYIVAPVICLAIIIGVCFVWKKLLPKTYRLFNGGRM